MKKESLERMKDILMKGLDEDRVIEVLDKGELMINLSKILESEETYDRSIKVLRKEFKKGR